jgi:hypothetical protein
MLFLKCNSPATDPCTTPVLPLMTTDYQGILDCLPVVRCSVLDTDDTVTNKYINWNREDIPIGPLRVNYQKTFPPSPT